MDGMLLMYQAQLLQVVAQMESYKAANVMQPNPLYGEQAFENCRIELWNIEQEIRRYNNL